MLTVERPDDSGQYDDATLLQIVAERFEQSADPITRRDARWLVSLARQAIQSTPQRSSKAHNCGEKSPCAPEAGG